MKYIVTVDIVINPQKVGEIQSIIENRSLPACEMKSASVNCFETSALLSIVANENVILLFVYYKITFWLTYY